MKSISGMAIDHVLLLSILFPDCLAAKLLSGQLDYGEGAYACTEVQFIDNIKQGGVNIDDVQIVAGFYDDTLTIETKSKLNLRKAAVVMIDCDLYESTVPVLDFITDLVDQGTIIIFDDWFRFKGSRDHGEQRACNEWLHKNPRINLVKFWQQGPQSVAFLVNIVRTEVKNSR